MEFIVKVSAFSHCDAVLQAGCLGRKGIHSTHSFGGSRVQHLLRLIPGGCLMVSQIALGSQWGLGGAGTTAGPGGCSLTCQWCHSTSHMVPREPSLSLAHDPRANPSVCAAGRETCAGSVVPGTPGLGVCPFSSLLSLAGCLESSAHGLLLVLVIPTMWEVSSQHLLG